jgi:hypothetical protein
MLEAEKKFRDKKASGKVTMADKLHIRKLRQEYRDKYQRPPEAGARPATISAKGKVT